MPKIIIANIDNEHMMGEQARVPQRLRWATAAEASRLAWFLDPGDILIAPAPLPETFLRNLLALRGLARDCVSVITPAEGEGDPLPLTFDRLLAPPLLAEVRARTDGRQEDWRVTAYYFDSSVGSFCRALGLQPLLTGPALLEGTNEIFNSKAAFRRLAAALGIPMAPGRICSSLAALQRAIEELIEATGVVIIKQDMNSGCLGNMAITRNPAEAVEGAAAVLHSASPGDDPAIARTVWSALTGGLNQVLVVESYFRAKRIFYAEYEIDQEGARFLNMGEQRMAPKFAGFEIPGALPPYEAARFLTGAAQLVGQARRLGFLGLLDVDGISLPEGGLIFNEINGRAGGCSHVHKAAGDLLGADYGDHYCLLTRNGVPAGSLENVQESLEMAGLEYSPLRREGIIILAVNVYTGSLDYLVVASNRPRAGQLEDRLLMLLEERSQLECGAA